MYLKIKRVLSNYIEWPPSRFNHHPFLMGVERALDILKYEILSYSSAFRENEIIWWRVWLTQIQKSFVYSCSAEIQQNPTYQAR